MTKTLRRLLLPALMLTTAMPAAAEWREATTENFVIVSEGSEDQLVEFANRLESVHWLLSQQIRVRDESRGPKVRIFLVPSIADVRRAGGFGPSSNVAGFYRPGVDGAIAVVPRSSRGIDPSTVLYHEYTHHFTLQHMSVSFPPWFIEGYAEVVSNAAFNRPGQITYGGVARHREDELRYLQWVPLSQMFAQRVAGNDRQGFAPYGQYWAVSQFMLFSSPERLSQFANYVDRRMRGQDNAQALEAFTGGINRLDLEAQNYLRRNRFEYRLLDLPASTQARPVLRVMRPGEGAIIPIQMGTSDYMSTERRNRLIDEINREAAQFPAEVEVAALQARLLHDGGRFAEAEAAADRGLAIAPRDPRLLTYKGLAMLGRAKEAGGTIDPNVVRAARNSIGRANRAAPNDPLPLAAYYFTYGLAGETPNELAMNGMARAVQLAPQDPFLRIDFGGALADAGQNEMAIRIFEPLAYSPHPNSLQAYALRMVEWLRSGATGTRPTRPAADSEEEGGNGPGREGPDGEGDGDDE